jgi:hypothetical protein
MRSLWPAVLLLALAAPAVAIVVDGANQDRYLSQPSDDPGWANVGQRGGTTAIYLGEGWVLTARHSALGEVTFDGARHEPVNESLVWIDDPSGAKSDLIMFRLQSPPALARLRLRREAPRNKAPVLVVGYGAGRGDAVEWQGVAGFQIADPGVKRWGLNTVAPKRVDVRGPNGTLTRCFQVDFTATGVLHEAQAVVGDSGGAVFMRDQHGNWQLAGVLLSVGRMKGQKSDLALFGNVTNAADLSVYAEQIERAMGRSPAP